MGDLANINLRYFVDTFKPKVFFETGTSDGKGVKQAQLHDFEKIISVEIVKEQADKMAELFKDDKRVTIVNAASVDAIKEQLPKITDNILFFLDAHFPGADCGYSKHDSEQNDDLRMPLEIELNLIKELRAGYKDVVLIDDIILYMDQGRHAWREDIKPRQKFSSDKFYLEVLANTHNGTVLPYDTHYAILTPK